MLSFLSYDSNPTSGIQKCSPSSSGVDTATRSRHCAAGPPQSARSASGRAGLRTASSRGGGGNASSGGSATARPEWRAEVWREGARVEVSTLGPYGHFGGVEAALQERFGFSYTAAEPTEVLVLGRGETARLFELVLLRQPASDADPGRHWRRIQAQRVVAAAAEVRRLRGTSEPLVPPPEPPGNIHDGSSADVV